MKVDEVLEYMKQRFGISKSVFKDYTFFIRGEKIWIASKDILQWKEEKINVQSVGILFARVFKTIKPTTNAAQLFGIHAKKNVIELSKEELDQVLRGYDISKGEEIENGYVILKYKNDVIGIGLNRNGRIKNQIPKSRRLKTP